MTRFANVPGASALASGRAGSVYASAAEVGAELAATWDRHNRFDAIVTDTKSHHARRAMATEWETHDVLHDLLAAMPAESADDAAALASVAAGLLVSLGEPNDLFKEEIDVREFAQALRMVESVARFLLAHASPKLRQMASHYVAETEEGAA